MYEMTPEHKKKISDSCKGKTRNKGKIYVTNGVEVHSIQESELDSYVERGCRILSAEAQPAQCSS